MQIDKKIKWANCCNKEIVCIHCPNFESCKKWLAYVNKHCSRKGYAHFDARTSLADDKTRERVLDAQWVARHGFWPLIHTPLKWDKFGKGDESQKPTKKKKIRDVRYPAHIDRCVFQRYAFLINELYDEAVLETGVDKCAIAYRTGKGLSTIDYAKSVFDFIVQHDDCTILVTDFKDFFEGIDHKFLKSSLCRLLRCDVLPADYYAVFKNTTAYSYWDWESLLKINHLEHCRAARKTLNSKEVVLTREEFLQNKKDCLQGNKSGKGIPQGSPLCAVLSNVYLSELDAEVSELVSSAGGLYYRYCDDAIVVLPTKTSGLEKTMAIIKNIVNAFGSYPGVEVQREKTGFLRYEHVDGLGSISKIDESGRSKEKEKLNYLGFTFDGNEIRIREKTIGKYYYRMRTKAKSAAKQKRGTERLYGCYSEKSVDIMGKPSFIDYARRAHATIDMNDPASLSVANHNMEKIAKALNEFSRDE